LIKHKLPTQSNTAITETSEGLHTLLAPALYSRILTTLLLAPLLTSSSSSGHLARVLNIAGGAKEGPVFTDDLQALSVSLTSVRGHLTSMITLAHLALKERYPSVSFIQWFPGAVKTNLFSNYGGVLGMAMNAFGTVGTALGVGGWITVEECGERGVFTGTSGVYPAKEETKHENDGKAAIGADGEPGSGVYSVDYDGRVLDGKGVELLKKYRTDGTMDKVTLHMSQELERILGKPISL
jgi:hypothetical protein